MAMITFDNHSPMTVSPHIGAQIWRIKEGLAEPETLEQARFVTHVRGVFLNPQTAPKDYMEKYRQQNRKRLAYGQVSLLNDS